MSLVLALRTAGQVLQYPSEDNADNSKNRNDAHGTSRGDGNQNGSRTPLSDDPRA